MVSVDDKNEVVAWLSSYLASLPNLEGKVVVDIPAGDGRSSVLFKQKGAEVIALDLFPEFMKAPGIEARFADMSERLPLEDGSVDFLLCQEGIEHVADQLGLLQEFNRVLKPSGSLIITAPSISHLRGRVSELLLESDYWKRMPPSEVDSVWFSESRSDRLYFGHVFMIGVQRLRTLAAFSGFTLVQRRWGELSPTSIILGVLFWPLIALVNAYTWQRAARRVSAPHREEKLATLREQFRLNVSPKTLFCKHIFWVLRKARDPSGTVQYLKSLRS